MFGIGKKEAPKTTKDVANNGLTKWLNQIFDGELTSSYAGVRLWVCKLCGTWVNRHGDFRIKHLEYYHKDLYQQYQDFIMTTVNKLDDEERGIEQR